MPDHAKVLHIIASDGDWEPFTRIVGIAAALRDCGYDSAVAAPDHSRLWEMAEAAGVTVADHVIERSLNPLRWRDFARMVDASGAGIVHVHDATAATLVARSGMFMPQVNVVSTRYSLATNPVGAEYNASIGAVVCPSLYVAEAFIKSGAAADKVRVVPGGVVLSVMDRSVEERDVVRAQYREKFCPDKEKPLFIVAIMPLTETGGQMDLLEIMPNILTRLPQCHLFLMGEGPGREEFERQSKIRALGRDVTCVEPDKAFHRLLAACDLYVGPARDDASGLMVQAAMAAGRASVLRRSGCYSELADDGQTAVFAADDGTRALGEAMLELLLNRSRRDHIGRLAKAAAVKRYGMGDQARKISEVYAMITKEKLTG